MNNLINLCYIIGLILMTDINGQTTNTPSTALPTTASVSNTTTASNTTSDILKADIDSKVKHIKSAISTQALAIVELEALTSRIRKNIETNKTDIEDFKKKMDDYHKQYDTNFELKIYLDEVDGEIVLAINSYADIAHKLNKIICLD